jgi:AGCS family alanine or glycine:cation symporter
MAAGIEWLAEFLFRYFIIAALLLTGLFLTVRFRFVQVRRFREAFKEMLAGQTAGATGALSPFQAFMTALAATIGTGNIAGVATAIISGGPGALFWIWVYGFLATTLKFSEAVLGVKFREQQGEHLRSGPMYYLRDGLKSPALAWTYACVAGIAALTTTPFTQPNSIAIAVQHVWPSGTLMLPLLGEVHRTAFFTGLLLAVLTWLVIIGGIKTIGRAVEKLSPLKVGLYLVGGAVVILTFIDRVPYVLSMVVDEAFSSPGRSGLGFGFFLAMRYGIARGIYANEAGYGTAAVAYGTARSNRPEQQGLQAVMEVFIVSFVTGTISAMAILLSGVAESSIAGRQACAALDEVARAACVAGVPTSTAAVATAFNMAVPTVGGWVVAICAFLFGYTTLIGWAYYGEQFLEYILGRSVTMPYRYVYCLLIPIGAVLKPDLVWAWGDLMNGLQVFPNIIGLIGLSGIVAAYAKERK